MKKKIVCFGVRDYEIPTFEKLAKEYDYELVLRPEYLSDSIIDLAVGFEVVMVRANCIISKENYLMLKEKGLKYYITRTAGYGHINLEACREYGIEAAYVPGYSPNAISELAVALTMSLLRNVQYTCDKSDTLDFKVTDKMFSKEIRSCTVGIIGCGRIGSTSAKLFAGLGAKVIANDNHPNNPQPYFEYVDFEKLLKESDVVLLHAAYAAGKNDDLIGEKEIAMMKDGAILINTARGELVDEIAVAKAVESGKLAGYGTDVIKNEKAIFNHVFNSLDEVPSPAFRELLKLYPKVIITPHVASATEGALRDMVEISLQNMDEYLTTGKCKNSLIK